RHPDHRRRQIWRQRRSPGGYRRCERAAPACPKPRHPKPRGRHVAGHRAATAPYAGDLGFARVCRRCGRSLWRARSAAMRRAYTRVETRKVDGGWGVALDGRPMRTPGKNELVLPSKALAAAIAAEWDAQREEIHPATMPLF